MTVIRSNERVNTTEENEIISRAMTNWWLSETATRRARTDFSEDMSFKLGNQWPESVVNERKIAQRPCLTINRLPQYTHQITNEIRQNTPAIRVFPVDDKGDIETAKIIEGIIRHIEARSNADTAYNTAINHQVSGGFGYYRVITQYENEMSFNQEIKIKRIIDPLSVYLDPNHTEFDYSDMNWGMIISDNNIEAFKSTYPDSKAAQMNLKAEELHSFAAFNNSEISNRWYNKDVVRVAEYFEKTFEKKTIVMIKSGEVMLHENLPDGEEVISKRTTYIPTIKWYKLTSMEILDETTWIGSFIPIIPVVGEETFFNGEYILESLIRHSHDSQRMYNYWVSAETESIALAPRADYVAAEGQVKGHPEWKNCNNKSYGVLQYTPVALGGKLVPPPQRTAFEPAVQAITNARIHAAEDIKATTGIYDAALGARSNEQTGIAINARKMQIQTSNYHFVDNFAKSQRFLGMILLELIPKILNTAQVTRIIGEDITQQQVVKINQMFSAKGKNTTYNLTEGMYDCIVTTGPGYASRRQDAVNNMLELTRSWPELLKVAGHLFIGKMDWDGAQEVAEQLKKILPPELSDQGNQPIPQQIKVQLQKMVQQTKELQAQLQQATAQLQSKNEERESKERIEFAKIYAQMIIAEHDASSRESVVGLQAGLKMVSDRLSLMNVDKPMDEDVEVPPQPMDMGVPASDPSQDQPVGDDLSLAQTM